jgi:hypothetical protein
MAELQPDQIGDEEIEEALAAERRRLAWERGFYVAVAAPILVFTFLGARDVRSARVRADTAENRFAQAVAEWEPLARSLRDSVALARTGRDSLAASLGRLEQRSVAVARALRDSLGRLEQRSVAVARALHDSLGRVVAGLHAAVDSLGQLRDALEEAVLEVPPGYAAFGTLEPRAGGIVLTDVSVTVRDADSAIRWTFENVIEHQGVARMADAMAYYFTQPNDAITVTTWEHLPAVSYALSDSLLVIRGHTETVWAVLGVADTATAAWVPRR